jgi:hypothetical protein
MQLGLEPVPTRAHPQQQPQISVMNSSSQLQLLVSDFACQFLASTDHSNRSQPFLTVTAGLPTKPAVLTVNHPFSTISKNNLNFLKKIQLKTTAYLYLCVFPNPISKTIVCLMEL